MNAEKRLFDFAVWLLSVTALLVMLSSCNPYEGLTAPSPTATATGTATQATELQLATPTPAPKTCTVSTGIDAGNLNLRSGASVGYSVITVLQEGQKLNVTDTPARGVWIQVKTADVIGWINSTYCKIGE